MLARNVCAEYFCSLRLENVGPQLHLRILPCERGRELHLLSGRINRNVIGNGHAHYVAEQARKRRADNLACFVFGSKAEIADEHAAILHIIPDPFRLTFREHIHDRRVNNFVLHKIRAGKDDVNAGVARRHAPIPGRRLLGVTQRIVLRLNLHRPAAIVIEQQCAIGIILRVQQLRAKGFQFIERLLDLIKSRAF